MPNADKQPKESTKSGRRAHRISRTSRQRRKTIVLVLAPLFGAFLGFFACYPWAYLFIDVLRIPDPSQGRLGGLRLVLTLLWPALCFLPVGLGASVAAVIAYRHVRSTPQGFCRSCYYNLTGNTSGVCPECGTPTDIDQTSREEKQGLRGTATKEDHN